MNKIKLTKKNIYEGNLILVNNNYPYKGKVSNLEEYNEYYPEILFNRDANKYLQFIINDLNLKDKIVPVSAYRSKLEQAKIYKNSLLQNGSDFTKRYVAKKGCSEHEIGLAIDLGKKMPNIDFIRPSFPKEGIYNKFREVSLKYGFIERYQKEKEKITNISAEEWHFRYVGIPHAEVMAKYNFCLEEYLAYLKNNKIIFNNYEIYYLPYKKNLEITLNVGDNISGDNMAGFIITKRN